MHYLSILPEITTLEAIIDPPHNKLYTLIFLGFLLYISTNQDGVAKSFCFPLTDINTSSLKFAKPQSKY